MTNQERDTQSALPFILILIWYALLFVGALAIFFVGLAFSNAPGGRGGTSFIDYLLITGPLIFTAVLMGATIALWIKGKEKAVYMLFGVSFIGVLLFLFLVSGLAI